MMSNQKRLEEYLVGDKEKNELGYLQKDISNGKVIMLSGKWGSGKTHFWKKKIQTVLNDKDKKIPNHYISLYGKTSIQEIKNEVFLKIFESVDSFKSEEKTKNIVKGSIDIVSSLTKSISVFGMSLDLSKITDKPFEKIDSLLQDEKLKRTENYLNSGAIICFDDFERKSKDIDLNDLFGFITQLTLNFSCKVVIILNDDVFEGEEKKIFSNVKEKSVSKFLEYEPTIKELFGTIFENDERYRKLDDHKEIILKTIEETEELNARIYIQVFDNLVEWIDKKQETNDYILRCLILVNMNFILYHTIFRDRKINQINSYSGTNNLYYLEKLSDESFNYLSTYILSYGFQKIETFEKYKIKLIEKKTNKKDILEEQVKDIKQFIKDNISLFKSDYFANKLDISENVDDKTFQKINNFIESGILINE